MDKRNRAYYLVSFDWLARDMHLHFLKLYSPTIKIHSRENGLIISCLKEDAEAVEYELRKAERNDRYCRWQKLE